jgi:hypothetical protein
MSKFDLMMDTLWGMVKNYLWDTKQKGEDIFEDEINDYNNDTNSKKTEKLSEKLKQEFLANTEKKDGTIDLR